MSDPRFFVHDVLTQEPLGELVPTSFAFNNPIYGAGQLECALTLPRNSSALTTIKHQTRPDRVALYVVDNGVYLWGGPVNYRDPYGADLTLKAQHWKAWFYDLFWPFPNRGTIDDEFRLFLGLLNEMIHQRPHGMPALVLPRHRSGVSRRFTIQQGWSYGQAFDNLSSRDGGTEWSIGFRTSSQTGWPELLFEVWKQGQVRSGGRVNIEFDENDTTNRVEVSHIPEDATQRRSRVWAAGDGQPATFAKDDDPFLRRGGQLLRESWTTWSGVTRKSTLASHARRERRLSMETITELKAELPGNNPDLHTYRPGDRARVRINDGWTSINKIGVRITDRAVSQSQGEDLKALLVLDMLDVKAV